MQTNRIDPEAGIDEAYEPPAVVALGSVSSLTRAIGDNSIEEPGMPVAPPP